MPGVRTGQRIQPLERAGVYVPGGGFPLISSLLMGAVPARGPRGAFGIALKIDDGATRASEVAMAGLLRYLDVLDDAAWARLLAIAQPRLSNWRGIETGTIRTAGGWLDGV